MFVKGDIFLARYFELKGEVIYAWSLRYSNGSKNKGFKELKKIEQFNSKRDEQSLIA